jgi:hypothetical protein
MAKELDRLIFMNVGSMTAYKGLDNDEISKGGRWVEEHGSGGEIFNFLPYRGRLYGYVQAPQNSVAIQRLGASSDDEYIDDVLVVWTAKAHVIGWYRHARVYRTLRTPSEASGRIYDGRLMTYHVVGQTRWCKLLDSAARMLRVPRSKGGMGRANVWYPDSNVQRHFLWRLWELIESDGEVGRKKSKGATKSGPKRQIDPRKRKLIEDAAIAMTIRYYEDKDYDIKDRQSEKVGWDLEARHGEIELLLEVKGLSANECCVEVTPREYQHMLKYRKRYRVCVVVNALTKTRRLSIFQYVEESGRWEDQLGRRLHILELVAARLTAV